jgi:hypothetical protein
MLVYFGFSVKAGFQVPAIRAKADFDFANRPHLDIRGLANLAILRHRQCWHIIAAEMINRQAAKNAKECNGESDPGFESESAMTGFSGLGARASYLAFLAPWRFLSKPLGIY